MVLLHSIISTEKKNMIFLKLNAVYHLFCCFDSLFFSLWSTSGISWLVVQIQLKYRRWIFFRKSISSFIIILQIRLAFMYRFWILTPWVSWRRDLKVTRLSNYRTPLLCVWGQLCSVGKLLCELKRVENGWI